MNLMVRVYSELLHLYPRAFRDEFAEEMQAVFTDAWRETAQLGKVALLSLCIRELCDSTVCILREQLSERSKTVMETRLWSHKPGPWREFLLAVTPFGLFALPITLSALRLPLPEWMLTTFLWMLFLIPILLFIGLLQGLPTWALPYLGLVMSFFNLVASTSWLRIQDALPRTRVPVLQDIYSRGSPLVGLIVLTLLFVLVTAAVKPLRPIYDRLRQDWSLLSFSLFGIVPLALFMSFDDHFFEEPYEAAALLVMATGAWVYLRTCNSSQRALILLVSITIVMFLVVMGLWMIAPSQPWAASWTATDFDAARWNALSGTIVLWGWLVAIVIATPALVGLLIRQVDRPVESR